uniref:Uncharacterized protein n=1 Tax=Timema cristinae TaxID=61476 RepID=A0A7R9DGJ7_TIMCR|nr:unnamed protein product [Timema cristinae]
MSEECLSTGEILDSLEFGYWCTETKVTGSIPVVVKLDMLPLLLLATMVSAAPLSRLDRIADLIAALQRYYSSDCVFLVHDVENHQMSVRSYKALVMVKKMLLYRGISVFTRVLGEGYDQPTCSLMIPLQVLYTSKTRLKYYGAKVSAALGLTNVRWLIWLEHNPDSLDNIFEGIDISYGSEVLFLQWTDSGAILTEVFRFRKDLPLQKLIFANWNRVEGLVTHESNRLIRRSDFHGLTLDVAVLHEPPNTILYKETDRPLEVTGYYGQVWRILEQKLNFT